jgi:hypothetical protein
MTCMRRPLTISRKNLSCLAFSNMLDSCEWQHGIFGYSSDSRKNQIPCLHGRTPTPVLVLDKIRNQFYILRLSC